MSLETVPKKWHFVNIGASLFNLQQTTGKQQNYSAYIPKNGQ